MSVSTLRHTSFSRNVPDSASHDTGVGSAETPARSDFGYPRELRLLQGKDYSRVFQRNRRVTDVFFTVLVHQRQDEGPARLGLAIAKKRARRAVDRNRIKRISRESFRHAAAGLRGVDLVVMNRDAAVSAGAAALRTSLDRLLDKAGRAVQHPVK